MPRLDEKKSKKNAGLFAEEIDAMGQESETKAVKWIKEIEDKRQIEEQKEFNKQKQLLADKRKYKKNPYYQSLYEYGKKSILEYDIPQGYAVDVLLKEDGRIIFGLQKVGFRWYAKGMKPCGEPKYDINCIDRMVIQTMLSLDELYEQHELHRTKEGIELPNKGKFDI